MKFILFCLITITLIACPFVGWVMMALGHSNLPTGQLPVIFLVWFSLIVMWALLLVSSTQPTTQQPQPQQGA